MDAACSRYARLHETTTLPELDEPDPWWAIPAPDADPQSSWLPDRHPVSVLELPELPELLQAQAEGDALSGGLVGLQVGPHGGQVGGAHDAWPGVRSWPSSARTWPW